MRIEIERLPIDAALEKYPSTQTMCVVINGIFYNDALEQYDVQTTTIESAWMFTPQTCPRCKEWGNHCIAVIIKEETAEEEQEKFDAMPPLKRLAYELERSKRIEADGLSLEELNEQIQKSSTSLTKLVSGRELNLVQTAVLMTVSTTFRRSQNREIVENFDASVVEARKRFNNRVIESDAGKKLTDIIIENL